MILVRLLLVVLGLGHLRGCAVPLCTAVGGYPVETVATRSGIEVLSNAVLTTNGDFLVETGSMTLPPRYTTTLVRMDERYGAEELAKFELPREFGTGLVAAGETWWFSLAGMTNERRSGVFFVTPERTFVEVEDLYDARWFPFDGAEPRGLLVGMGRSGGKAVEVTRGGVVRRWPVPPINVWGYHLWAAERLPDGAIALFSVDRDDRLLLRLLDGNAEAVETELPHDGQPMIVSTALAPDGMVAAVVRLRTGEVEAALVDPRNPAAIKWHTLTEKRESGMFPTIAVHDGKVIVAWSSFGRVRARVFTAERAIGPPATIAPLHRRGERAPSVTILPAGEELVFVWQDYEVMTRRVPAELAGFELLESLCARFLP